MTREPERPAKPRPESDPPPTPPQTDTGSKGDREGEVKPKK